MKPLRGWQQGTGGGATPAPSYPPTTAPDEEGITELDCLRQKGREKRARSKQRMYSPIEGRMQTPHRRPLPSSPTTHGTAEQSAWWDGRFYKKT